MMIYLSQKLIGNDINSKAILYENTTSINQDVRVQFPYGTILNETFNQTIIPGVSYYLDSNNELSILPAEGSYFGIGLSSVKILTDSPQGIQNTSQSSINKT